MDNTQHGIKIVRTSNNRYTAHTTWPLALQQIMQMVRHISATSDKSDSNLAIGVPLSLKDMLQSVEGIDSVAMGDSTASGRYAVDFTTGKMFELTSDCVQGVVGNILGYVGCFGEPVQVTDQVNNTHYYALLELRSREVTELELPLPPLPKRSFIDRLQHRNAATPPAASTIRITDLDTRLHTAGTLEELILLTTNAPQDEAPVSEEAMPHS